MGLAFALGSACFVVGPFPGYAGLVGATADAVTFFVGSIFFTIGGALQTWIATRAGDRAGWWAAVIQSAGTLFFNVSTFRALHLALSSPGYDRLVWRPDAYGSICFLVSGVIAYQASARHGWWPARDKAGWWQPAVNLLGCVLFGISAITAYVLPASGSSVDQQIANVTTSAGAACFLICAVGAIRAK
jgi:hypothetical protein